MIFKSYLPFPLLLLTAMVLSHGTHAQVSGTVFMELPVDGTTSNTYGVLDANEMGLGGVTVTITDVFGNVSMTSTVANGTWSDPVTNFPIRVEFTWPNHPWLQSSPDGISSNTSVQFINAASTNVNFGLHDPGCYSESDPEIIYPTYVSSSALTGLGLTGDALEAIPYTNTAYDPMLPNPLTWGEIGSTYGIAYDRINKRVFAGAFLKRHAGLRNSLGHIYVMDYSDPSNPSLITSFNLQGAVPANGGANLNFGTINRVGTYFSLSTDPTMPSYDIDAFSKVGKVGYGDLDVDGTGQNLWAVNLNDRALVKIDISGATLPGSVEQYPIESIPGLPACSQPDSSVLRPFGLKFYQGRGYLGLVCTQENVTDPAIKNWGGDPNRTGFVLSFDAANPMGGFTVELSFPFNYRLGQGKGLNWRGWYNKWPDDASFTTCNNPAAGICTRTAPQPVISDIEFDAFGNMTIGVMDRFGHQVGYRNRHPDSTDTNLVYPQSFGDILYAHRIGTGWQMEGCATCPPPTNGDPDDAIGPEEWYEDYSGDCHEESGHGALAILKGSNTMISTKRDPYDPSVGCIPTSTDPIYSNKYGLGRNDVITGDYVDWYNVGGDYWAKASGIGDIEMLSEPAPVEIGNFVWEDGNSNGIQDPGEQGIANIVVELVKNGSVVASATTDANGNYVFSNASGTSSSSHIYNIAQLMPDMDYVVRFPLTTIGGLILTGADMGSSNTLDSDANTSTGEVQILSVEVPISGANNHTFDVGYATAPNCVATITQSLTVCNDNGTAGNSSDDWFSLDVTGTVTDGSGNYVVKIGSYTSAATASGSTVTIVGDGQGGNPSLMADGFSTYTVRVEDELDNTCFTEFTVGPVSPCSNCRATATRSSILCDNNGTPADSLDDWYSIDIAGTINGGSGSYVVKVGGYTSGVTASGSTITLVGDGQGGNPMLPADGVTTVVFRIEDALDSDCYTTMSVRPISPCSFCPAYNCSSVTTSKD